MSHSIQRYPEDQNDFGYIRSLPKPKTIRNGYEPYLPPKSSHTKDQPKEKIDNIFKREITKQEKKRDPIRPETVIWEKEKWPRGVSVESDTRGFESFESKRMDRKEKKLTDEIKGAKTSREALDKLFTPGVLISNNILLFLQTCYPNESSWADKCKAFNSKAFPLSADIYIAMIEQTPTREELCSFWEKWQKEEQKSSSDNDLVYETYLRSLAKIAPEALIEEWEKSNDKHFFKNKTDIYNAYLKGLKKIPPLFLDTGKLDRSRRNKNIKDATSDPRQQTKFTLSELQTVYDDLVNAGSANKMTYQLYLQLAIKNDSPNEVEMVYQQAKKTDKIDQNIHMIYIDYLVAKDDILKAENVLKNSVHKKPLVRFEEEGAVSVDFHGLSHGTGYIFLKTLIGLDCPSNRTQIKVIHGIGSGKGGKNYLAFKGYLEKNSKHDPNFEGWCWEICRGNPGCSILRRNPKH